MRYYNQAGFGPLQAHNRGITKETIMTDYDILLRITRIVEGAKLRMGLAERGECPEGMSEEQWEDAQLSDVLDQIAEGAIADIRGILR